LHSDAVRKIYSQKSAEGLKPIGIYLVIFNHKVEKVKEGKRNRHCAAEKTTGTTRVFAANPAFLSPPPQNSGAIYGANHPSPYGTTTKNFFDFFGFAVKPLNKRIWG
jgi:hypothetical protein